jgi:sulfite exporter TauE/SafE
MMYIAPFLIGVAGSLHCIGMCSPLVMSVVKPGKNMIVRNLLYNTGRILTYCLMGALVSFAGKGLYLAGIQQWVSILAGITLLLVGIGGLRLTAPAVINRIMFHFSGFIKERFAVILRIGQPSGTLLLGMINGLLPCGLTLAALAYCITLEGPLDGFVAMIFFGLGTVPAMVGFASVSRALINRMKVGTRSVQTALIVVSAIILMWRGVWLVDGHSSSVEKGEVVVCGP